MQYFVLFAIIFFMQFVQIMVIEDDMNKMEERLSNDIIYLTQSDN